MAAWAFEVYVRRQARRHFAGMHLALMSGGPLDRIALDAALPTICVANHTNWWDGFLAYLVTRSAGRGFRVLMEAQQLARYRVFLRGGALPLRRDSPRGAYEDLRAAGAHLEAGTALWIFPQGARRPAAEPVAGCERGAAHLALCAGRPVRICPVAFRYVFLGEQRPEAFALVGEPWTVMPGPASGRRALAARIEAQLGATVAALDARLAEERLGDFEPLVRGTLSANKKLDRFRHATGLLAGPFEPRNG